MKTHHPFFFGHLRIAKPGFALVITLFLMVLLAVLVVGLLTISSVSLRTSSQSQAIAEAQCNARMGLMIAIGELQKSMGIDQRISAPSGILDPTPDSADEDGLTIPHLTGVWNARDATQETLASVNATPPDYSRDKPNFQRWLVSNANPEEVEQLHFAQSGTLVNPVPLLGSANGATNPKIQVKAGRVPVKNGSYAWWVGDENCKALVNPRDLREREDHRAIAELLANFATPGVHGMKALANYESFPSNTSTSDKYITRDQLAILPPPGSRPGELFHDITPYAQSILTNVTTGSLRKDLNLYLERTDIDWLREWRDPNWLTGPLGPNGQIALSPLAEYDVLAWKTLHHYYHMARQVSYVGNRPRVTAIDNTTPDTEPIANPRWNDGVTSITPVLLRMQWLLSYGSKMSGALYDLYVYNYPVITLWNPYNVDMVVNGFNIWQDALPLQNVIYKNDAKIADFMWAITANGNMQMRMGTPNGVPGVPIILKAGEQKVFNYAVCNGPWNAHDMSPDPYPYTSTHAGKERKVAGATGGAATDRISMETTMKTWPVSAYNTENLQSTFELRTEPCCNHLTNNPHPPRTQLQSFSSLYAWRFEDTSPMSNQLSQTNFPSKTLEELLNAPTPYCLIDVRLKPLDEVQLPNKTWLHNIPSLNYAGCTSTSNGTDAQTPFFSHPYTATFDQRTTIEGLFSTVPYMGPSYTPAGQRFVADREVPLVPLSSLAQLQNLPQCSMESLHWGSHFQQNHAIGNSYASPGIPSDKIKCDGWPFYLTSYLNYQGGSVSGSGRGQSAVKGDWTTSPLFNPASRIGPPNIDRSYAANQLLWDEYYFSSMAPQDNTFYQQFGASRGLKTVVDEFYNDTRALPNAAYVPYLGGMTAKEVSDALVTTGGSPLTDAYQKSAAHLMANGGFNINSTSVPAWTILLASAHLKRPVIMDTAGAGNPAAQPQRNFFVSRFTMPIGGGAGRSSSEDMRWRGYRELTALEIRQLAEAVVRQVKRRGPFRSLGEFINRRMASASDEAALYGALQAALEDPRVEINKDYRGKTITAADISRTHYAFKQAALGPRYQGTPAYISQADILQPIAPILNARSDTFLIRSYGEALAQDGKTVLAHAWCEAVVQRSPAYLNPEDPPETPMTSSSLKPENKIFGRRFVIKSFRWLSPHEI